jgi:chromate reductase
VSAPLDVVALVGSLRAQSITRRIVTGFARLMQDSMTVVAVDLAGLPLYNDDLEAAVPPAWTALRERVTQADAVLFATPEYNRSVPGVLKNALDVGSRPYGRSAWAAKPAAIISVSPGSMGGFGANHHLRQSLVFLNMPTLQQPEVYLAGADKLVDDHGDFKHPGSRDFLRGFGTAFEAWIRRQSRPA